MTEKRFHKAYCCGDTGVIDGLENEWFIENINSISDLEKNWENVIDKLNQVAEENEKLKHKVNGLKSELTIWKEDANEHIQETNKLFEENEKLKQAYQTLKHRHSLLHDVCIEAECDRDRYHKDVVSLEKEMEQLKSTNMEMEDYLGRLEEANINLQIKLQKIRDYAKKMVKLNKE